MKKRIRTEADGASAASAVIIAEIGTSHGGDLKKAADLIAAAAESGADVLKTQIVFADEIIHPNTGEVSLPGGSIRLYDSFRALEQKPEFYLELKRMSEAEGMEFLASPFGSRSLEILLSLGGDSIKIASPELNHFPLLAGAAASGRRIILSTGVSRLADIEAALDVTGRGRTELMHCITSYPAPEEQYNLRVIPALCAAFGVPAGISDHSLCPRLVPGLSAALGACSIEKHFTLSRSGSGLDDPIALPPRDFAEMTAFVRSVEAEADALAMMESEFGRQRIKTVLGDGVKRLADSEAENYGRTNRSVHALRTLEAGEVIDETNTALLRTEKKLRPGIRPELWNEVIGRKLSRRVESGEGIVFGDLFDAPRVL